MITLLVLLFLLLGLPLPSFEFSYYCFFFFCFSSSSSFFFCFVSPCSCFLLLVLSRFTAAKTLQKQGFHGRTWNHPPPPREKKTKKPWETEMEHFWPQNSKNTRRIESKNPHYLLPVLGCSLLGFGQIMGLPQKIVETSGLGISEGCKPQKTSETLQNKGFGDYR